MQGSGDVFRRPVGDTHPPGCPIGAALGEELPLLGHGAHTVPIPLFRRTALLTRPHMITKLVSWRDQEDYWAPDADAIAFQDIIRALGRIGDHRAIKPLKKLIDPKDISKHRQEYLSNAIENIMKKKS